VGSERGRVDRVALTAIVVLVLLVGGGYVFLRLSSDDSPADPGSGPSHKPSHSPKPQTSTSPSPSEQAYDENHPDVGKVVRVTYDHASTAEAPGIPVWESITDGGGKIVEPGGSTIPVKQMPSRFVHDLVPGSPLEGSWVVLTTGSKPRLQWMDGSGKLQRSLTSVPGGLISTPDGSNVAYLAQTGFETGGSATAWSITSNTSQDTIDDPRKNAGRLDGFLSGGKTLFEPRQGHLQVFDPQQSDHPFRDLPGSYVAGGPTNRATDMYWAQADDDSCWGVATYPHKPLSGWRECYAAVGPISPDGDKVVLAEDWSDNVPGSPADDSAGPGTLWIRNAADNSPVVVYVAPQGGFFSSFAWDGDQLDAVLYEPGSAGDGGQPGSWSLLYLGARSYRAQVQLSGMPGYPDKPPITLGQR
jgi:hypothetical protein